MDVVKDWAGFFWRKRHWIGPFCGGTLFDWLYQACIQGRLQQELQWLVLGSKFQGTSQHQDQKKKTEKNLWRIHVQASRVRNINNLKMVNMCLEVLGFSGTAVIPTFWASNPAWPCTSSNDQVGGEVLSVSKNAWKIKAGTQKYWNTCVYKPPTIWVPVFLIVFGGV